MICRKCKNQIVDTARFCPFCGEPAAAPPAGNADKPLSSPPQPKAKASAQPKPQAPDAQHKAEAPSQPKPQASGGRRVKGIYVLGGAAALFLVAFFATMLFTRVLPGKGALKGEAGSVNAASAASSATADASYADDAARDAVGPAGAGQSAGGTTSNASADASYADDAARDAVGPASTGGTTSNASADASYADDAARDAATDARPAAQTGATGAAAAQAPAATANTGAATPIPILKVERHHAEGANGFCEENYTRVSLGAGTDVIFPELSAALEGFSEERIAEIETEYSDLVSFAEETQRKLSVNMSISLARADENVVSLIYGFSDYSGGAHGYYFNSGAAFDVRTGERLKLADLCTDTARLAEIIAADLYEEDSARFSAGEEALRQTIQEYYLEAEGSDCWVVMPDGIMFYFPPYGISYYAAGQPLAMVRFAEHGDIFNGNYCTPQGDYVTYLPGYGAAGTKADVDGDGRMDEINFYAYSKEVDSAYYYQDIHIFVNGEEHAESTPIFREAGYGLARVGGRTFLLACTDNLDGTAGTYVFDLTDGKALCTDMGNESIFAGSALASGYSEMLQAARPEGILMGGDAEAKAELTAEGLLE